jgi:hypothetical protein
MAAIVLDPAGMAAAVPLMERYLDLLEQAYVLVGGITIPVGVPPSVRGQVEGVLADARGELIGALRALGHLPAELRRRVQAARQADSDWPLAVNLGAGALRTFGDSFTVGDLSWATRMGWQGRDALAAIRAGKVDNFDALREFRRDWPSTVDMPRAQNVPDTLLKGAKGLSHGAAALDTAAVALDNFTNPNLSDTQKVTRTAASLTTDAGVSFLAAAGSGAAFGSAAGPPGLLIGVGASVTWSVLDSKLGVSNAVGDAAADVVDGAGSLADDAVDGAKKVVGKLIP